jgi:hypothetical protein
MCIFLISSTKGSLHCLPCLMMQQQHMLPANAVVAVLEATAPSPSARRILSLVHCCCTRQQNSAIMNGRAEEASAGGRDRRKIFRRLVFPILFGILIGLVLHIQQSHYRSHSNAGQMLLREGKLLEEFNSTRLSF